MWEEIKEALNMQFLRSNFVSNARQQLVLLRHTMPIMDYIKSFSALMLQIRSMREQDCFFAFTNRLKEWGSGLKMSSPSKNVTTLVATCEVADHLID